MAFLEDQLGCADWNDLAFWDTTSLASIESSIVRRTGGKAYKMTAGGNMTKNLSTALSEFYHAFGLYVVSTATSSNLIAYRATNTNLLLLGLDVTTGLLTLTVGSTQVAAANLSLPQSSWNLIEIHGKIADSGGYFEVRLDGLLVASFNGDTKPGADTTVNNFRFTTGSSTTIYVADLRMNDTSGATDNAWLGDGYTMRDTPDGNGSVSQWTGSDGNQVNNYALVNESTPDGDTTYITDTTPGNRDQHALPTIDLTGKTITRVVPEMRAKETVPAGAQVKLGVSASGTVTVGSAISLTTVYRRHVGTALKTNPATGSAWSDAVLSAAETVVETV